MLRHVHILGFVLALLVAGCALRSVRDSIDCDSDADCAASEVCAYRNCVPADRGDTSNEDVAAEDAGSDVDAAEDAADARDATDAGDAEDPRDAADTRDAADIRDAADSHDTADAIDAADSGDVGDDVDVADGEDADVTDVCVPSTEVCDGVDNDCDGAVDLADDSYEPTPCPRDTGVCADAVFQCDAGVKIGCDAEAYAAAAGDVAYQVGDETYCDGEDNNCDGFVDENCCTADDLPLVAHDPPSFPGYISVLDYPESTFHPVVEGDRLFVYGVRGVVDDSGTGSTELVRREHSLRGGVELSALAIASDRDHLGAMNGDIAVIQDDATLLAAYSEGVTYHVVRVDSGSGEVVSTASDTVELPEGAQLHGVPGGGLIDGEPVIIVSTESGPRIVSIGDEDNSVTHPGATAHWGTEVRGAETPEGFQLCGSAAGSGSVECGTVATTRDAVGPLIEVVERAAADPLSLVAADVAAGFLVVVYSRERSAFETVRVVPGETSLVEPLGERASPSSFVAFQRWTDSSSLVATHTDYDADGVEPSTLSLYIDPDAGSTIPRASVSGPLVAPVFVATLDDRVLLGIVAGDPLRAIATTQVVVLSPELTPLCFVAD